MLIKQGQDPASLIIKGPLFSRCGVKAVMPVSAASKAIFPQAGVCEIGLRNLWWASFNRYQSSPEALAPASLGRPRLRQEQEVVSQFVLNAAAGGILVASMSLIIAIQHGVVIRREVGFCMRFKLTNIKTNINTFLPLTWMATPVDLKLVVVCTYLCVIFLQIRKAMAPLRSGYHWRSVL